MGQEKDNDVATKGTTFEVEHPLDLNIPGKFVRTYKARLVHVIREPIGLSLSEDEWESLPLDGEGD